MRVLAKHMENRFIQSMVEHLRTDFAAQISTLGLTAESLRHLVCDHINTARKHGIRNRGDLTTYIECIAYLGPQFDIDGKHPFVQATLLRGDLVGDEKMDRISEYLIFAVEEHEDSDLDEPVSYRYG